MTSSEFITCAQSAHKHSEGMRAFRFRLGRVDLGRVWMHHWEGVQRIISDV